MHTSISDCELSVILVGSVINWLSPYISKMLVRFAELWSDVRGNKLQFKSPNRYNSQLRNTFAQLFFDNEQIF